ncbi:MAG: dipeptide epimerase [Hyphomicrobiales bacterium]|nr:dipeptide epimerase [Hyphomicrobiales bacterium]
MARILELEIESFPIAGTFTIARGAKTEAVVVAATISEGAVVGRGECVPYARYGESVESVAAAIEGARAAIEAGCDRAGLQALMPAGAARNALDCALWDFEAKRLGVRAYQMAGLHRIAPATTAFTISVGTPDAMASAAAKAAHRPLLKVKLAGAGDPDRIAAVRAAAPACELIVDANEAWAEADLETHFAACAAAGVALVEQPLPAGRDGALASVARPIPVCADESVHDRAGLAGLRDRYDAINIKLDKTGGLTEALALAEEGARLGFSLFVGCMVGTSLAMAPAMLLTPRAQFVDLDGPLLLARDRSPALRYDGSLVYPSDRELWG